MPVEVRAALAKLAAPAARVSRLLRSFLAPEHLDHRSHTLVEV
jgi:hypothetical protein